MYIVLISSGVVICESYTRCHSIIITYEILCYMTTYLINNVHQEVTNPLAYWILHLCDILFIMQILPTF